MDNEIVIAGLDEAGRGAVMGPLVVAGVSIEEGKEAALRTMKVRDSKLLSPARRETLAKKIGKVAKDIIVIKVSACKIDSMRKYGTNLNRIEAIRFIDAMDFLKPHKAYIDGFETNLPKLTKFLAKMSNGVELTVEHKADSKYPVVSAASIIAKVERDKAIAKLSRDHGEVGSGYPSDPVTIQWLKSWLEKEKEYPDFVRKSWITAEVLQEEKKQMSLGSWLSRLQGAVKQY